VGSHSPFVRAQEHQNRVAKQGIATARAKHAPQSDDAVDVESSSDQQRSDPPQQEGKDEAAAGPSESSTKSPQQPKESGGVRDSAQQSVVPTLTLDTAQDSDNSSAEVVTKEFHVDEPCEVWSEHVGHWVTARVKSVEQAGANATLITCRLDGEERRLQRLFAKSPLIRKIADGAAGVKSPTAAK